MVGGGVFLLLGAGGLIWSRREEGTYYDTISGRHDVREYLEREPERPEPGALKIGGWLTIGIGIVMVAMGAVFWYCG